MKFQLAILVMAACGPTNLNQDASNTDASSLPGSGKSIVCDRQRSGVTINSDGTRTERVIKFAVVEGLKDDALIESCAKYGGNIANFMLMLCTGTDCTTSGDAVPASDEFCTVTNRTTWGRGSVSVFKCFEEQRKYASPTAAPVIESSITATIRLLK